MALNPFSSEFTCEKCGYRSEHLLMACSECGWSAGDEIAREPIPASHITPTGKYLAPIDPVKSRQIDIKVVNGFKIACGGFALIIFLLLIPFYVIPVATGPDSRGYYRYPKGKGNSAPTPVSEGGMNAGAVAIIIVSALFGIGYFILKNKQEAMEARFEAEGHTLSTDGN